MAVFVLTVLGADRPGLVDHLSGVVSANHGNWERSQMARLGGKFAGIVEVTVPDHHADQLHDALTTLGGSGVLDVRVERTERPESAAGTATSPGDTTTPATMATRRLTVSLVGTDRPGLVHAISAAMASAGANIEQLTTSTTDAPMSGDPLFEASAVVTLPEEIESAALRAELESLADRLMVDLLLAE